MAIENIEIIVKSDAEKQVNPLKDLRKQINGLKNDLLQLEAGTEEYNEKAQELANTQLRLRDINEEARYAAADLGEQLATTNRIATGLASGFSAAQGIMALFGGESEALQKTMVKLQAGIALVQGLQGMEGLVRDLEIAKIQFRGGLTAVKGFIGGLSGIKKALLATGIGAFIVLIGTLIAYWDEIAEKLGFAKKKQEEVNVAIEESTKREKERKDEVNRSVGEVIGKYKLLQRQWQELSNVQEKNQWIKENSGAFKELGLSINDVNAAQSVFVTNSEAVIKAIKDQARARAMAKLYEDAIAKQYTAQQELEDAQQTAEQRYYNGYVPTDEEAENAGLGDGDYGTLTRESSLYEQWIEGEGKYTTDNYDWVDGSGARKLQDAYTQPFEESVATINGEVAKLEEAFVEAEQTAAESAAAVQQLGINYTTNTGSSSSGSSGKSQAEIDAENIAKRIEDIQKRLKEFSIDTKEEELAELERIYNEELALLGNNEQAKALLKEEYDANVAAIEKKYRDKELAEEKKAQDEILEILDESLTRISSRIENSLTTVEIDYQLKALEIPENDAISAINLEIEKERELMTLRQQAFNEQMLQIQTTMNSEILTAEQRVALLEQYQALEQEKVLATAQANAQIATLNNELANAEKKKRQDTFNNVSQIASATLSGASQLISALQQNIDTTTEEGFEKNKQLQKANTWINVASGILSAVSSAMTIPPPVGPILAGVNSAFVLATGIAQIAAINKQKFDGSGGGDSGGVSVPNVSATMMSNEVYANQLSTQTEVDLQNEQHNTRVYVVESDITESQNSAKTKVSESEF
mgnify:CR=1 FL=1